MPSEEAGYTYAVEPAATNRLLANEEESIYDTQDLSLFSFRHPETFVQIELNFNYA